MENIEDKIRVVEKLIDLPLFKEIESMEIELTKTQEYRDYLRLYYGDIPYEESAKKFLDSDFTDPLCNSLIHSCGHIKQFFWNMLQNIMKLRKK